jgi:hypothetical protein
VTWQPIRTVPYDGVPVLVFIKEPRLGSRVHVGTFRPNVSVISSLFSFDMPEATHWMPLPEPPK